MTRPLVERLESRLYSARRDWVEGTLHFHRLCAGVIGRGAKILEIGAGPSNRTSRFLATLGEVYGLDPDPDVLENDALAGAKLLESERYPFADRSFDYCVSDYVVEHVPDGEEHLREVARVLKPGGAYAFRTVNKLHYVALIARLTPHWFHVLVANRARANPDGTHDPYPTVYAMNSGWAIRKAAAKAGLKVEKMEFIEKEPAYARFSAAVFLLLAAYERLLNASDALAPLRANLFVVLRRPSPES